MITTARSNLCAAVMIIRGLVAYYVCRRSVKYGSNAERCKDDSQRPPAIEKSCRARTVRTKRGVIGV